MEQLFMERKNRDKRAKELKKLGYRVRRFSHRNQLLHPTYVEDWPHKLSDEDKGFGNILYKTPFSVLYGVGIL